MPALSPEITALTGIDQEHLDEFATNNPTGVLAHVANILKKNGYCVAHNAPFDKGMVSKAFELCGLEMPDILWIDTSVDIPYPETIKTRKLIHLLAEHGINPNDFAHRGLFDILKTFQLLSCYDIAEVVKRAKSPNITIQAICRKPWEDRSPEGEKDTDKAKANGFRWNGENKSWLRVVKDFEIKTVTETLPFKTRIVDNGIGT
jgi:DNA polymerase III epsilon subunit-like protein